ncbi:hypothetical protein JDV02_007093 [Purpureocillium takamizusanense]|uniref:Uncharacterized protein n=1 Tax=Purpureocillium takamizusanense TaxID=2060973 RepID=A0A9Q8QKV2_9HYPO|nr:uncharacterized protein JDV02_007093 [Purpureocillium takamizusanense]UNI21072.1 hypothetical protein JDV02_007093 [Purpureocillium takamizusanense]
MMWPSTATALFLLFASAHASIQSIAAPEVIKPGDAVNLTIVNNISPGQYDVALVLGFDPNSQLERNNVGIALDYILLKSMPNGPFNQTIHIHPSMRHGPGTLRAGIFSIYGALGNIGVWVYDINITLGDATSTKYIKGDWFNIDCLMGRGCPK